MKRVSVDREYRLATVRQLRVRGWLLTLALVPLAGAAWFAFSEVDQVATSRQQAEAVGDSTKELVHLTELHTRVLDERTWATAEAGIADLGFDSSIVKEFVGIDLERTIRDARVAVDELLVEVGWHDIEVEIARLRSDPNTGLDEMGDVYEVTAAAIKNRADRSLDALLMVAGDIDDGADLVAALRALAAASQARQAVSLQLTSYFGAQFGGPASGVFQTLIEQQGEYVAAMDDVARIAGVDTATVKTFAAVEDSEHVAAFRSAVVAMIENPPIDRSGDGLDIAGVMAQLDTIAATFESATESIAEHVKLVKAAGSDVEATSRSLDDSAAVASRNAWLRIAALGAASLLFALGLARAIGRPLRELAGGARGLRDGEGTPMLRPSGPKEVREAMLAINEASAHIELAERQARALALGELDNPALTETAPGALGQSLHTAVRTLAASLSAGEEFQKLLAHEATHDSLTQLANRSASLAQLGSGLERTCRSNSLLAVMFVDLDGFKSVNDRCGHSAGDTVLRVIGERLYDTVRRDDHIGRLGGDEFLIVAEPVGGPDAAIALAERIVSAIEQPIPLGSTTVRISACIGVALADQTTKLTAYELLHEADLALYKAKELGGATIQLCDDSLHAEVDERSRTETELRLALANDELVLYYQPIVDACCGRLLSLEALVRWQRPGVGLIPPGAFIPIAERSDLIVDVDKWVIRHAAQQLAEWTDRGLFANIPVAINVSGRHLTTDHFVDNVLKPARDLGVDPSRLVLEVTESALVDDFGSAARNLRRLREQGVLIAIDDFGTGYTSLEHLRTLPIDILKIDRTFTCDESASSLVKLIIDTGHLLGVRVTAEGIETPEQAAHLAKLGSDELQGYLFGRPVPPSGLRLVARTSERDDRVCSVHS